MTEQLGGTGVWGVGSTNDEKEDGGNEMTRCEGTRPAPYPEFFSSFGLVERTGEEGGNGNAALHLQKARMAFPEAHACKPVRQADIYGVFLDPRRGRRVAQQVVLRVSGVVFSILLPYGSAALFWFGAPTTATCRRYVGSISIILCQVGRNTLAQGISLVKALPR